MMTEEKKKPKKLEIAHFDLTILILLMLFIGGTIGYGTANEQGDATAESIRNACSDIVIRQNEVLDYSIKTLSDCVQGLNQTAIERDEANQRCK